MSETKSIWKTTGERRRDVNEKQFMTDNSDGRRKNGRKSRKRKIPRTKFMNRKIYRKERGCKRVAVWQIEKSV